MQTFEHETHIDAPAERVADYVTSPANWATIHPTITDVRVAEEREDGALVDLTYRMAGIPIPGRLELTVEKPDEHIVSRFSGRGMSGRLDYYLTPEDEGTGFVQHARYELTGTVLDRVLEPVARRYNERQFERSLVNLRTVLEAETPARV